MATERDQYQNLSVAAETAFATLNDPTSYTQLGPTSIKAKFDQEAIPDGTLRTDRGQNPPIIGSKAKGAPMEFECYFTGLGTAAGDGVAAGATGLGKILNHAIGTEDLQTGDTVKAATPGTAAQPRVTTAARFADDTIVGIVDASGLPVWRHVESVSSDTLTLSYEHTETPVSGNVIYQAANYPMSQDPIAGTSLQFRWITERSDEKGDMLGCAVRSVKLSRVKPTEVAKLSFTCVVTDWDDSLGTSLASPTLPTKSPWFASHCILHPFGVATYSAAYNYHVRSVEFEYDNGATPDYDPHSENGVAGYFTGADSMKSVTLVLPATDDWRDAWAAGSFFALLLTFGRVAGRTAGVWMRKLVIAEMPSPAVEGGVKCTSVKFVPVTGAAAPQMIWFLG